VKAGYGETNRGKAGEEKALLGLKSYQSSTRHATAMTLLLEV